MKTKIALAIVFGAGGAIGATFSPWRYQLVTSAVSTYRLDRLTGSVDRAAGNTWTRIVEKPKAEEFLDTPNAYGDRPAKP